MAFPFAPRIAYDNTVVAIVRTGTGNGTLTAFVAALGAPTEVWTITFTSATTFTVVGSISGAQTAGAALGAYNVPLVQFTLTAGGTAFVAGDKFTVTLGTQLLLINSSGIWVPDRQLQGGVTESAAGVPETYVLRKDGLLAVPLRAHESEWAALAAFIDWAMTSGSLGYFTFFPDQAKLTPVYQAWLVNPKVGDRWGVKRVPGHVKVLELDTLLRTRVVGQLFDIPVV